MFNGLIALVCFTTGLLVSTVLSVAAEGLDSGSPSYFNILVQGGSFAVLVWVVHHLFTKTIPGIVDRFNATTDDMRKGFQETLREERERTERMFDANNSAIHRQTEAITSLTAVVARCNITSSSRDKNHANGSD